MVAYLICFVGFAVARLILYNEMQHIIIYSSSMFFIGSLAIGGGYAILPLMLTEFTLREYVGPEQFWDGFSVASILPGPNYNIAIYVGAVIDGVRGALICWIAINLTTFLAVWGVLPYWSQFRKDMVFSKLLHGFLCIEIGFIIASTISLYETSANHIDIMSLTSTLICFIAFIMLHVYDHSIPMVIIVGGMLTNVRALVRVQYRGLSGK